MPKRRSKMGGQPQDADSDSEYDDEITTFHKQREKILLDSDPDMDNDTEEEEVYTLVDEEESDEEIAQMQQQLRQIRRNKVKQKMDSDLEPDDEDEDVPDSRAWGSKQSWFMGGDVRDNRIILSGSEDEAGAAVLEEKECLEIEKQRLARMKEEDYMPHFMKKKKEKGKKKKGKGKDMEKEISALVSDSDEVNALLQAAEAKPKSKKKTKKMKKKSPKDSDSDTDDDSQEEENGPQTKVKKTKKKAKRVHEPDESDSDLEKVETKLTKEEEFEKNKRLYPEYIPLVNDFQAKMKEMQERIIPLMWLVKKGKIEGLGKTYIQMKYHVISNYLICGGFYMYLMTKRTPRLHHHPVMKRLLEFQQFYNRLVPVDKRVKKDLDTVLEKVQKGEDIEQIVGETPNGDMADHVKKMKRKAKQVNLPAKKKKVQHRQEEDDETDSDEDDDEGDKQISSLLDAEEEGGEDRRAITYQMEKNKGLTVYKKKELKNPRVKHRTKYRRAVIRRKGQVREFKPHKTVYTGEITGIRAGIIRSRKLK